MSSEVIITVPVPDGHTSARFFEFDWEHFNVLITPGGAIQVLAGEDIHQEFAAGQWSRVEFPLDD